MNERHPRGNIYAIGQGILAWLILNLFLSFLAGHLLPQFVDFPRENQTISNWIGIGIWTVSIGAGVGAGYWYWPKA